MTGLEKFEGESGDLEGHLKELREEKRKRDELAAEDDLTVLPTQPSASEAYYNNKRPTSRDVIEALSRVDLAGLYQSYQPVLQEAYLKSEVNLGVLSSLGGPVTDLNEFPFEPYTENFDISGKKVSVTITPKVLPGDGQDNKFEQAITVEVDGLKYQFAYNFHVVFNVNDGQDIPAILESGFVHGLTVDSTVKSSGESYGNSFVFFGDTSRIEEVIDYDTMESFILDLAKKSQATLIRCARETADNSRE